MESVLPDGYRTQELLSVDGNVIGVFTLPSRYSNLEYISAGSQGMVASADDNVRGERVAIKKMTRPFGDTLAAKRAFRELMLLSTIQHPNIIQMFSAFTPQSVNINFREIYLVMELMEHNLHQVIRRLKLDHKTLSFFVYQLLCAVHHLHKLGIIHRDLKPSNVVVNNECKLKVLDFGLARMKESEVRMSECVVTRYYRAPEIILSQHYNEKDIWSIGCILAEMVNHRPLFVGENNAHQWRQIVSRLGTPSDDFINQLPDSTATFIRGIPRSPPIPFSQLFPDRHFIQESEEQQAHLTATVARNILSRMLEIDEEKRCTVGEALRHPYVKVWFKEEEVNMSCPEFLYDHEVESSEKTIEEWRDLIYKELKLYEDKVNVFNNVQRM